MLAMARAGLSLATSTPLDLHPDTPLVDAACARAALLVSAGDVHAAAALVLDALAAGRPGSDGWLIPLDPMLDVRHARHEWVAVFAMLGKRAS